MSEFFEQNKDKINLEFNTQSNIENELIKQNANKNAMMENDLFYQKNNVEKGNNFSNSKSLSPNYKKTLIKVSREMPPQLKYAREHRDMVLNNEEADLNEPVNEFFLTLPTKLRKTINDLDSDTRSGSEEHFVPLKNAAHELIHAENEADSAKALANLLKVSAEYLNFQSWFSWNKKGWDRRGWCKEIIDGVADLTMDLGGTYLKEIHAIVKTNALDNDNVNTGYIKKYNEKARKNIKEKTNKEKDIGAVAANKLFVERRDKVKEDGKRTVEFNIANDIDIIEDLLAQNIPSYDNTRINDAGYNYREELNSYGITILTAYNNAVERMEKYLGNEDGDVPEVLQNKINTVLDACKAQRTNFSDNFNEYIMSANMNRGKTWRDIAMADILKANKINVSSERDIVHSGQGKACYSIEGKKVYLPTEYNDTTAVVDNVLNDFIKGRKSINEFVENYDSFVKSSGEALKEDLIKDPEAYKAVLDFYKNVKNGEDYIDFTYKNRENNNIGNLKFFKFITTLALIDDNQKSRNGERNDYINKALGDMIGGLKIYSAAVDKAVPLDNDLNKNSEAFSRFADMLGIGNMVTKSRNVRYNVNGKEENCLVEEKTTGQSLASHKEENRLIKDDKNIFGIVKIFDFLCGHSNRTDDSIHIKANQNGMVEGIEVSDNLLSFCNKNTQEFIGEENITRELIRSLPISFIDELKKMDESSPELIFGDLLEKSQIESFRERLKFVLDEISLMDKDKLDKEKTLADKNNQEKEAVLLDQYLMNDDTYRYYYYMVAAYDSGKDMKEAGYNTDLIYDKENAKIRLETLKEALSQKYITDRRNELLKGSVKIIAAVKYQERHGLEDFRRSSLVVRETAGDPEMIKTLINRDVKIPKLHDLTDEQLLAYDVNKNIDEIKKNTVIPLKMAFLRMVAYGKITDPIEINHYKAVFMSFEQMENYYDARLSKISEKEGWGAAYSKHLVTESPEELIRHNEKILGEQDEIDKIKYKEMFLKLHPGKTISENEVNRKMIEVRKNIGKKEYYSTVEKIAEKSYKYPAELFLGDKKSLKHRSLGSLLSADRDMIHVEEPVKNERGEITGYTDKVVPYTTDKLQNLIANLNSDDKENRFKAYKQMLYQLKFFDLSVYDDTTDEEAVHSNLLEKTSICRVCTEIGSALDVMAQDGYQFSAEEYHALNQLRLFGQRMSGGTQFEKSMFKYEGFEYILKEDIETIDDKNIKKKYLKSDAPVHGALAPKDEAIKEICATYNRLSKMPVAYKPGTDTNYEKKYAKAFGSYKGKNSLFTDASIPENAKLIKSKKNSLKKAEMFSNKVYDKDKVSDDNIKNNQVEYIRAAVEEMKNHDILEIRKKDPDYVSKFFHLYKRSKDYAVEIKKSVEKFYINLDKETLDFVESTIKTYDLYEPYALDYMKLVQMPGYVSLSARGMLLPNTRIDPGYSQVSLQNVWEKLINSNEEKEAYDVWRNMAKYWENNLAATEPEFIDDTCKRVIEGDKKPYIRNEFEIVNDYYLNSGRYRADTPQYFTEKAKEEKFVPKGEHRKVSNTVAMMCLLTNTSVKDGYQYYKKGMNKTNLATATDEELENFKECVEWAFDYIANIDMNIFKLDNDEQIFEDFEKKANICSLGFDFRFLYDKYVAIHDSGRLNTLKYNTEALTDIDARVSALQVYNKKIMTYAELSFNKIHKTPFGKEVRGLKLEEVYVLFEHYRKFDWDNSYAEEHPEINFDKENTKEIMVYLNLLYNYYTVYNVPGYGYLKDGNALKCYQDYKTEEENSKNDILNTVKDALVSVDFTSVRSTMAQAGSKAKYRTDDADKCKKIENTVAAYASLHNNSIETTVNLQTMLEINDEKTDAQFAKNKLKAIENVLSDIVTWDINNFEFDSDKEFAGENLDTRLKKLQSVEGMGVLLEDYEKLIAKGTEGRMFTEDDVNEIKARISVLSDVKKVYDIKMSILGSDHYKQGIKDKIDIMSVKDLKIFSNSVKDDGYLKLINSYIAYKEANSSKSNLLYKTGGNLYATLAAERLKLNPKHKYDSSNVEALKRKGIAQSAASHVSTAADDPVLTKYYTVSIISGEVSDAYMNDEAQRKELIKRYAKDFGIEATDDYIKEVEEKFSDRYKLSKAVSKSFAKENEGVDEDVIRYKEEFKAKYKQEILNDKDLLEELKGKYKIKNNVNEVSDETVAEFYSNINLPRSAISLMSSKGISEEDKYEFMYMSAFGNDIMKKFNSRKGKNTRSIKGQSNTIIISEKTSEDYGQMDEASEARIISDAKRIWKTKIKLVKMFAGIDINRYKFESAEDIGKRANELPELMHNLSIALENQGLVNEVTGDSPYDVRDAEAPKLTKEELIKAGTFINASMALNQGLMNQIKFMITPGYSLIDIEKLWDKEDLLGADMTTFAEQDRVAKEKERSDYQKLKTDIESGKKKVENTSLNLQKRIRMVGEGRGLKGTTRDNFDEMVSENKKLTLDNYQGV
ncbi:MAG: hypothetical protein K6F00_09145 [Lachnospiraceae bacterium]|nr:hypothetical protein [Lachnospiraceae bacterium]